MANYLVELWLSAQVRYCRFGEALIFIDENSKKVIQYKRVDGSPTMPVNRSQKRKYDNNRNTHTQNHLYIPIKSNMFTVVLPWFLTGTYEGVNGAEPLHHLAEFEQLRLVS